MRVCTVAAAALTWLREPGSVREDARQRVHNWPGIRSLARSLPRLSFCRALCREVTSALTPLPRGASRRTRRLHHHHQHDDSTGWRCCLLLEKRAALKERTYPCCPRPLAFHCKLSRTEWASKATGKCDLAIFGFSFVSFTTITTPPPQPLRPSPMCRASQTFMSHFPSDAFKIYGSFLMVYGNAV